ncbi:kinase-like domain-containing protein [Suillus subaureus]|uniref:mitogen-activated protein kinase kinase n=1 Tax=Suillus subaureus TaxID=48587 RepID=A0A9P7J9A0_9AGAM|nr:kinase-like domain-containing protein [Suillus subaureus]KAG1809398.1 kinase-like domain-containing protein [Suillus subaureus]
MLNRGLTASPGSAPLPSDPAAQAQQHASINESSHPILQSSHPYPTSLGSSSATTRPRGRGGGVPAAGRRNKPGLKLSDINPETGGGAIGAGLGAGRPSLAEARRGPSSFDTPFSNFNKIVDPSGRLNFAGKAVLHAEGVDFSNGSSYAINMDQLVLEQELGRGNYGTVKKVLHRPTKVEMAMKEIRLELDSTRLNGILMELDILHRAVSSYIVDFYGAFFVESCVYYCMEHMDGGSLASLCCFPNGNVSLPPSLSTSPGSVWTSSPPPLADEHLCRIASSMTHGLEFLKTELGVMHRDVKPTNVLVNCKGEVKLCDFGVSGQLEKSIAKTNVGCQSYMAPERIKGSSPSGSNMEHAFTSYTVSADVWSLGLSIVEIARGRYPYPPETYENVFAQLSAIVDGEAPGLPEDEEIADEEVDVYTGSYSASPGQSSFMRKGKRRWSPEARDWVRRCLIKNADERATYKELLAHPWMQTDGHRGVDMVSWVAKAIEWRDRGGR